LSVYFIQGKCFDTEVTMLTAIRKSKIFVELAFRTAQWSDNEMPESQDKTQLVLSSLHLGWIRSFWWGEPLHSAPGLVGPGRRACVHFLQNEMPLCFPLLVVATVVRHFDSASLNNFNSTALHQDIERLCWTRSCQPSPSPGTLASSLCLASLNYISFLESSAPYCSTHWIEVKTLLDCVPWTVRTETLIWSLEFRVEGWRITDVDAHGFSSIHQPPSKDQRKIAPN